MCSEVMRKVRSAIAVLQDPLPLDPEPFSRSARRLGISQEEVLALIAEYARRGIIRRVAGLVKHDRAGFAFNAMIAFEIDRDLCDAAGEALARLPYVTHCYRRARHPDWPYSLYAMAHARDAAEFAMCLREIKQTADYRSVAVFESVRKFKKTSFRIHEGSM